MFDDLLDRPLIWKEFDCFTLAREVRQRLGLPPLPVGNEIYRNLSNLDLLRTPDFILELLKEHASPVRDWGEDGDLVAIKGLCIGLGTVIARYDAPCVLFFGKKKISTIEPLWDIENLGVWRVDD
jgi:hypothetical protein